MTAQILKALAMLLLALAVPGVYVLAARNMSDPWGMLLGIAGMIVVIYFLAGYMRLTRGERDD